MTGSVVLERPPGAKCVGDDSVPLVQGHPQRDIFIATLAHELRQPLSTMLTSLALIRPGAGRDSEGHAVNMLRRQVGQMSRLVDDLLDAARWATGKVALRVSRVDVRAVMRDAAQDVAIAVAARHHELTVTVPGEPLWIDADGQRLQQVLSNLLRNAVSYTDPGGRILLTVEARQSVITLRVVDTGRGIAADALPRVFDLFSQVRPLDGAGLGVGLSVVRDIVTQHGGSVEVRSEGIGQGSEFSVTLPAAAMALATCPPVHVPLGFVVGVFGKSVPVVHSLSA